MSSLLYLQVALPECESGRYSRVIHLGRKSSVDGKLGAFSLVLGQTHTDSKFLLGMSIGVLLIESNLQEINVDDYCSSRKKLYYG